MVVDDRSEVRIRDPCPTFQIQLTFCSFLREIGYLDNHIVQVVVDREVQTEIVPEDINLFLRFLGKL